MDINAAIVSLWSTLRPGIAGQIRHVLTGAAASIGTLGLLKDAGSQAQFVDIGTAVVFYLIGAGWAWWTNTGQAFVQAYVQVVVAKTLAQAQAMRQAGLPQVTVKQIALQSSLTIDETTKIITKLPAEVQANISAPSPAAKIVAVLAVMIVAMFLAGLDPAMAREHRSKTIVMQAFDPIGKLKADLVKQAASNATTSVNNIATVLAKPFQDLANFIGDDADGAVALATAIPSLQDGHGQQCGIAMQSFGAIIKAHPVPITFHVINDYESLRLLAMATNNLCSNVHCTQFFSDFTAMAQAASPVPLAIPSLHDLCTKVPQIAVVAPVAVPAATTAASSPPDSPPAPGPTGASGLGTGVASPPVSAPKP